MQASSWQGPLPPPDHLAKYEEIVPGAAERMLAMAERQQNHRMPLEDLAVREQLRQSSRGQIFGLFIGLGGIGLAGYLGFLGMAAASGTVGGFALGGLAIAFITGRSNQPKPPAPPAPGKSR